MKEFMKERGELAVDMGTRRQMGVRIQIGVQEGDDDVQLSFALLKKNTKLAGEERTNTHMVMMYT